MTLEELGAALRQEREKRGLLVDDVADHLKISTRLVRALEEGDRSSLPHLAYTRGFVRSYAVYLGMAADEVSSALLAMSEEREDEAAPMYVRPRRQKGSSGKWLFVLLLLIGLAGLGYAAQTQGWLDRILPRSPRLAQPAPPLPGAEEAAQTQAGERAAPPSVPDRGERGVPAGIGTDAAAGEQPQTQARKAEQKSARDVAPAQGDTVPSRAAVQSSTTQTGMPPAGGTGEAAHNDDVAASQPLGAAGQVVPGQTVPQAPADGTVPASQHRVVITAVEECWIHSNADNTDTRQFSLKKGDTFALTFTNNLRIKLGNAGGVRIRYNGQEMPAPGSTGQVRTLTFPPVAR